VRRARVNGQAAWPIRPIRRGAADQRERGTASKGNARDLAAGDHGSPRRAQRRNNSASNPRVIENYGARGGVLFVFDLDDCNHFPPEAHRRFDTPYVIFVFATAGAGKVQTFQSAGGRQCIDELVFGAVGTGNPDHHVQGIVALRRYTLNCFKDGPVPFTGRAGFFRLPRFRRFGFWEFRSLHLLGFPRRERLKSRPGGVRASG
jgi:hypothetical protein